MDGINVGQSTDSILICNLNLIEQDRDVTNESDHRLVWSLCQMAASYNKHHCSLFYWHLPRCIAATFLTTFVMPVLFDNWVKFPSLLFTNYLSLGFLFSLLLAAALNLIPISHSTSIFVASQASSSSTSLFLVWWSLPSLSSPSLSLRNLASV